MRGRSPGPRGRRRPAPASAPNPASDANPARKMTAMRFPAMHPGSPPGAGAGGFGDVESVFATRSKGRRRRGRLSSVSVAPPRACAAALAEHRRAPGSILSVAGGARPEKDPAATPAGGEHARVGVRDGREDTREKAEWAARGGRRRRAVLRRVMLARRGTSRWCSRRDWRVNCDSSRDRG